MKINIDYIAVPRGYESRGNVIFFTFSDIYFYKEEKNRATTVVSDGWLPGWICKNSLFAGGADRASLFRKDGSARDRVPPFGKYTQRALKLCFLHEQIVGIESGHREQSDPVFREDAGDL